VILVALLLFFVLVYIAVCAIRISILLLKSIYYYFFARGSRLDHGFKKHVLSKEEDSKKFDRNFNANFNNFINGKD